MKQNGRPKGTTNCGYSRKKSYNRLSVIDTHRLVADYDLYRNCDLMEKYDVSYATVRDLRIHHKLKTKQLTNIITKKRNINYFNKKCGIYAIVREDCIKAYIGSSSNIKQRLLTHLSDLENGNSCSSKLQADWGKLKFFFCLIKLVPEEDLLKEEHQILDSISKFCFYNEVYMKIDQDIDYSKCCNPLHLQEMSSKEHNSFHKTSEMEQYKEQIIEMRSRGIPYKEIKIKLGIRGHNSTICRYYKRYCC